MSEEDDGLITSQPCGEEVARSRFIRRYHIEAQVREKQRYDARYVRSARALDDAARLRVLFAAASLGVPGLRRKRRVEA